MFCIYGGAFMVGSNSSQVYGPQVLLDRNLVLVCANYRVGALGFLSNQTDQYPGNLGGWGTNLQYY